MADVMRNIGGFKVKLHERPRRAFIPEERTIVNSTRRSVAVWTLMFVFLQHFNAFFF